MKTKIWFITGCSKGFGKVWAEAALKRGDKVAATARNIDSLASLKQQYGDEVLLVTLDVNNREACFSAVNEAINYFGKIDILVNNAGFGHFGYVEEISESEARQQIETNLFGSLWMIQAVLPIMRNQKNGHILQVSSIGGIMAFPSLSIYHASKWAVEGICESMNQEVAQFGIKTTLIEPAAYATEWATASASFSAPIEAYNGIREAMLAARGSLKAGDPNATADAILRVVDAANPPLRLFLGKLPLIMIEPTYNNRLETWKEWNEISANAE
ncbi:short-chain dehydrogenase/reductase [Flavobacterium sediminis]|uniref:Short-chain dehydrogenase/reductase n=1 Tax=Flavobacterium sediminis TaxID=2201181 RepID=A0A2U8QXQ1_9FLAO|nr:SDR family NAD(P)-dependent oxidoreductase [Flavobacterium sediminis]AWM14676.1 short-chain dehydrogenase/reductase [Flavobacterium sediminis]MBS4041302.1 SDR family NAD(P)-dependent oxidoreductase [Flavobacteriales bacterium]